MATLTQLIDAGYDALWPLFERLEAELDRAENREARLQRYRR